MKVYYVEVYVNDIVEFEADKVTSNSVWINGKRKVRNKEDTYNYFTNFQEAYDLVYNRLKKSVDREKQYYDNERKKFQVFLSKHEIPKK